MNWSSICSVSHRLQQARLHGNRRTGRQVQGAALGAETPEVGRVGRVTTHASDLRALTLDDDAAAHPTVGTR